MSPCGVCAPRGDVRRAEPIGPLLTAMPSSDRWGPFADGIDEAERRARLRTMRAIVHLTTGPRGERLAEALRLSERDTARLLDALDALAALAPIDRRHVLASFARLHRPA